LIVVAAHEQRFHAGDDQFDPGVLREEHVDPHHTVVVEQILRARHRHVCGIVDVEAERLALRRHHADHDESTSADVDVLTEGVRLPEQLSLERRPEHDEREGTARIGWGQEAPESDLELPDGGNLRRHPIDGDAPSTLASAHTGGSELQGHDALDTRHAVQCRRILDGQLAHRGAEAARHPTGRHLAR
jgi:hypothetical protein